MESNCHKTAKQALCNGNKGTEHSLPSGKRIDCISPKTKTCYEIEQHKQNLGKAVTRLTEGTKSGLCNRSVLITRDNLIPRAKELTKNTNIKIIPISKIPGIKSST
jgi:hypothetical protein